MKIKVMTYNLPYWGGQPEPKCFNSIRREHIKKFLLREKPDLIGFQEMQDAAKT